jgi:purine-binding chemotaxis protein CheW
MTTRDATLDFAHGVDAPSLDDAARAVLDARAAALARVPAVPPDATDTLELLTFRLADEQYAFEVALVREVHRQPAITPLPGTPKRLLGVTNLRGEIMAVMDLGELFGIPAPQRDGAAWLIVLGRERAEFGVVCDSVQEVLSLRLDALRPAVNLLAGVGRELVRGVTAEALIVLDGERVLADERLYCDGYEGVSR